MIIVFYKDIKNITLNMCRFWVVGPSDVSQPKGKRFEIEGGGLHFGLLSQNFLAFPRA